VVLSDERIPPPEVSSKIGKYPSVEEIVSEIREFTQWVVVVESARIAKKAGSVLARNSVLLGALVACGTLPVKTESLLEALRELVPKKHVDVNVEAFKLGYDYVRKRGRKKRLSPVGKF
jgi:indolepyruvate ferredoxin oxidoreductase beta subunit